MVSGIAASTPDRTVGAAPYGQPMEPRPLNAAQQLVSDLADLCRARPAVWSSVVHRADQLAATGVTRSQAYRVALDEVGWS